MDLYLTYWKQFLCYCLNALQRDKAVLLRRHRLGFSGGLRRGLEVYRCTHATGSGRTML